jgi:ribosome-binding factor A
MKRARGEQETCVMGKTKREHRSRGREDREGGDATRVVRLQELIREEVNLILRNEVRDPRLDGVVITMVELAGDGSCARLWFTAEGDEDRREACEHIAGFLRTQLAESLGLKRTPELRFRRDPASRALRYDEMEI